MSLLFSDATEGRRTAPGLVLAILTAIYTFNFLDRQLVSILAEPIKRDLHLSDTQLGLVSGIFFALFYTTLGIPLAWVSDRTNRIRIIACACSVWSVFSMACGLAGGFTQLALARIGVGSGEAGGTPPAHSLLSDYFPPERRGTALAIYSLGVPIGAMLASLAGGAVAARYGWRAAFFATGAPGLLLALIALIVIREPRRSRPSVETSQSIAAGVRTFVRNPVLRKVAAAAAASAFVAYSQNWMAAFLIRSKGMQLSELAIWYSLMGGAASIVGTFLSGWLCDRFAARNAGAYGFVPMTAHLATLPLFLIALYVPGWPLTLVFYFVPAMVANVFLAPAIAVVQNAINPQYRAIGSALLLFTFNLIGLGGGPLFVGAVSDLAHPYVGEASLTLALTSLAPFFLLAALLQYRVGRALVRQAATRSV